MRLYMQLNSKPDSAKATKRQPAMLAGLCAVLLAGVCQAQTDLDPTPESGQRTGWLAASDRTLDGLRGGFNLANGLFVSFGISRAVYVNGELITSTSLQIGDLNRLTAPQAQSPGLAQPLANQIQVVQNGPGNLLERGALTVPFATYIQNSLNNQTILNQTSIEATSNSLGLVKNLNFQTTIDAAIANAIGAR